MVRSPTTSLPLNSALRVSLKRDVMLILPSFWSPKNHASSSVPLQAYAAISVPSTAIPMTIGLPSGDVVSAMYFADCGKGAGVAGAAEVDVSEALVSVVDVLLEQAGRAPRASSAMTPRSRMRM